MIYVAVGTDVPIIGGRAASVTHRGLTADSVHSGCLWQQDLSLVWRFGTDVATGGLAAPFTLCGLTAHAVKFCEALIHWGCRISGRS